jgi:hypothetical protein
MAETVSDTVRLTKAQRSELATLAAAPGMQRAYDLRTMNALLLRGLVTYDGFQELYRITQRGLAALEDHSHG